MRPPWRFEGIACPCECGNCGPEGKFDSYFWEVWDLQEHKLVQVGNMQVIHGKRYSNCEQSRESAELEAAEAALKHEVKFRNAQRVQEDQLKALRAGGSVPVGI